MHFIKQFYSIESFETERLVAKKISQDDLPQLIIMHSNPQVMGTLGGVWSEEKTQRNLTWNLDRWQQDGFGLWMFYLKETQEWVGRGGIRKLNIEGTDEIEVAYSLMPSFWQLGLATEIANACIEIASLKLHLPSLVAVTLHANKKSQRVMQKAGFKYERDVVIHFEGVDFENVLYRINLSKSAEKHPH